MTSTAMTSMPSSMLPAQPQGCAEFDRLANELFSNRSESIAAAVGRIAEWQSRENIAEEIEISAVLVNIIQRKSEFIGDTGNEALSQDSLKAMLAMTIHRLVITVANQCPGHGNPSTIDSAKAGGLPSLLVDIHDGWSQGILPKLSVLKFASAQALCWLKANYWGRQKEALKHAIDVMKSKLDGPGEGPTDVRATLKGELESYIAILAEIFSPSARIHYFEHRNEPSMSQTLETWNRARNALFKGVLDLSLSSRENLVSIIVDDGLLTKVDTTCSKLEVNSRLSSARDTAWKFTILELSIRLPRLPAMLLASIMKQIKSNFSDGEGCDTGRQSEIASHSGTVMIEERLKTLKRLTSWFHWLLGKRASSGGTRRKNKAPRRLKMRDNDLPQLKLLNIFLPAYVTVDLGKEFSGELLQVCRMTSALGKPLLEFEPGIAVKLMGCNLQQALQTVRNETTEPEDAYTLLGTAATGEMGHNSSTPAKRAGESSFKTKLEETT